MGPEILSCKRLQIFTKLSAHLCVGGGFGEAGSKRNVGAVLDSDATCGDEGWFARAGARAGVASSSAGCISNIEERKNLYTLLDCQQLTSTGFPVAVYLTLGARI